MSICWLGSGILYAHFYLTSLSPGYVKRTGDHDQKPDHALPCSSAWGGWPAWQQWGGRHLHGRPLGVCEFRLYTGCTAACPYFYLHCNGQLCTPELTLFGSLYSACAIVWLVWWLGLCFPAVPPSSSSPLCLSPQSGSSPTHYQQQQNYARYI